MTMYIVLIYVYTYILILCYRISYGWTAIFLKTAFFKKTTDRRSEVCVIGLLDNKK